MKKAKLSLMILLSFLVLIISLNHIIGENEQDLMKFCNLKTKIDIKKPYEWNKYLDLVKSNVNENNRKFRIHDLMVDGYEISTIKNENIYNKIRPLTIHINDSRMEIATINTFEIEIRKWYLSENRWSSCPQAYSSIFFNSTFN